LPFVKVTFLPVDWSMRAGGQYVAREDIWSEKKKKSCDPFPVPVGKEH
jgi:hypothetical protein